MCPNKMSYCECFLDSSSISVILLTSGVQNTDIFFNFLYIYYFQAFFWGLALLLGKSEKNSIFSNKQLPFNERTKSEN